jgi:hypothetical protein
MSRMATSWLKHYATRRKVAGLSRDKLIHNPSSRSIAPGLTQSVTETSTRNQRGRRVETMWDPERLTIL